MGKHLGILLQTNKHQTIAIGKKTQISINWVQPQTFKKTVLAKYFCLEKMGVKIKNVESALQNVL